MKTEGKKKNIEKFLVIRVKRDERGWKYFLESFWKFLVKMCTCPSLEGINLYSLWKINY